LKPNDPATLALAVAALAAVAAAASFLPAHRAARLDPMDALREDSFAEPASVGSRGASSH